MKAFDVALIGGVTGVACAMGLAVAVEPGLFLPLLAVHTWCFGFDHVIATFTRIAGRPQDRRRHRLLIYMVPPLAFFGLFGASWIVGVAGLNTAYFLFQWFHTTRQSWGIAQHYRRAAGGVASEPVWLSELTLWAIPVAGILRRCHDQPVSFLYMNLQLPPVPDTTIVTVLAALLTLAFFVRRLRSGELASNYSAYFAAHSLVFALGYLAIDSLHAGWLLVNVWHNAQYLLYVWQKNRDRFAGGVRAEAPVLSWLCQPGHRRTLAYFAALLAVSTPLFTGLYALTDGADRWLAGSGVVSMTLLVALAVNFHHYIVDGIIWRRGAA